VEQTFDIPETRTQAKKIIREMRRGGLKFREIAEIANKTWPQLTRTGRYTDGGMYNLGGYKKNSDGTTPRRRRRKATADMPKVTRVERTGREQDIADLIVLIMSSDLATEKKVRLTSVLVNG
jgi:hypothetical protein